MVDVSSKSPTVRTARATARIRLPAEVKAVIRDGEIQGPKGPVFQTAIIAGTMAAKKTHELIPFCHPLGLESCRIGITLDDGGDVLVDCTTRVTHRTGVEMEALTGASVAALTIYDSARRSHDIVIADVRLVAKTGGKSDLLPVPLRNDREAEAGAAPRPAGRRPEERLARDKAAVRIGSVALLDRAVDLLNGITAEVHVAVRPEQVDDAVRRRHRLLTDPRPDLGPAGGLLAAHLARPDAAWLVLACDMPAIEAGHLGALVARRDPVRAGVAWRNPLDGLPEPLCALYEPATLARLAGQVAAGRPVSPRARACRCRRVAPGVGTIGVGAIDRIQQHQHSRRPGPLCGRVMPVSGGTPAMMTAAVRRR